MKILHRAISKSDKLVTNLKWPYLSTAVTTDGKIMQRKHSKVLILESRIKCKSDILLSLRDLNSYKTDMEIHYEVMNVSMNWAPNGLCISTFLNVPDPKKEDVAKAVPS